MTLKQMAALNVAKFMGSAVLVGAAVALSITYFGLAKVGVVLSFIMLIYAVRMVYQMEVDKLERLNTLNKIKESGK